MLAPGGPEVAGLAGPMDAGAWRAARVVQRKGDRLLVQYGCGLAGLQALQQKEREKSRILSDARATASASVTARAFCANFAKYSGALPTLRLAPLRRIALLLPYPTARASKAHRPTPTLLLPYALRGGHYGRLGSQKL